MYRLDKANRTGMGQFPLIGGLGVICYTAAWGILLSEQKMNYRNMCSRLCHEFGGPVVEFSVVLRSLNCLLLRLDRQCETSEGKDQQSDQTLSPLPFDQKDP